MVSVGAVKNSTAVIEVTIEPGTFTKLIITLPRSMSPQPGGQKLNAHILIVDDEPDVESLFRQQFRRDIRSGRFIMEFANSAPQALERTQTIAGPLLILSDINMPGMSGLEMLLKVKAERPSVPVIMITAYGDEATKRKAEELGAAGLLTKPIDFGLLRDEIDQRLARAA